MSQRSKRSKKGKGVHQDISGSTLNMGGLIARHDRGKDPEVRVPLKATGDIPAEKAKGLAQASPLFQPIKDAVKPESKQEEAKAVAEATVKEEKKEEKAKHPAPKQRVLRKKEEKTEDNAE